MMELKKRSDLHWPRRVWHMLGVSIMAAAYAYLPLGVSMTMLIVAWLLFVPVDFLRQRYKGLNEFMMHLFRPILRQNETDHLAGTTYLLTGVLIVALICPRPIVQLTLLFLAFADPCASFFGIRYGKDKILGNKSLQGTMAAFIVCVVLTAAFLATNQILTDRLLIVSLLGGLVGCLAELIPIWKLDDNLTLPVFSATFLWVIFSTFGAL